MDAEKAFTLITVSLAIIAIAVAYSIAVIIMPLYTPWMTWGLLVLFALVVLCSVARSINEQVIRYKRVQFKQEFPLSEDGSPYYVPQDMHVYPQRTQQGSQQQEQGGYYGR